ncbi:MULTISPECIES: ABC transporter ATP-binding protein [Grimontia]|uniref:Spermidine/putrescine import ATP-binding protein PotA n=1 Tax=Grimontia marina TaxID=646534 RepID=A0A128FH71_9GAMM|nr:MULTISPECIES: ABC transporter ATP-binding protein [Grimontia]WRW00843.1 ABC transporter ATP-binding protein [Grimontia sp. NTOU-MAR1]CZF85845.1 Spermidine/putrescine import ATP-binding protein PotA [Grimontia marina]
MDKTISQDVLQSPSQSKGAVSTPPRIAIEIRNAVKRYGHVTALKQISMSIKDNEFFTLLGPSGCGKTTLLRMIAGFEGTTEGEIFLFGREIEGLPPFQRPVNTVFQNYALFPHMTILDNVAFGPEMRGSTKNEARKKACEMLDLVQLSQFANRKPGQLSGGQQQRVALARALAPKPKVLLLDEPLSALDLKLRKAMQIELKHLQRETGITFIFVTHDQEEALTMSDRIAVMSEGELQQLDEARDIYEKPRNTFVANFIGETNLLPITIDAVHSGEARCQISQHHTLTCACEGEVNIGDTLHVSIRPERLYLSSKPIETECLQGQVQENMFIGTDLSTRIRLPDGTDFTVRTPNSERGRKCIFSPGSDVFVNMEQGAARLLID